MLGPLLFILSIESINDEELKGQLGLFADDTREGLSIGNVEDAFKVQNDLIKLGHWSNDKNMLFNNLKFECIQTEFDYELKEQYNYITPDQNHIITIKESVKDLGVWMSNDGNFNLHIQKVISKVKQRVGWIRRSFMTNNPVFMKFMWRSYISGILDYNSQIWSPIEES